MIFIEKKITINNNQCKIDSPVVLYRGDYNIEVRFTIVSSRYKYSNKQETNVIESTEASYGQLVIQTPNTTPIFSEVTATKKGAITFTITAEMIDEVTEIGSYTFQIRLLDENKESRVSIPEVVDGIEIREPIAIEDTTTNEVNVATVGYALTTVGTPEDAFDSQGNYNKTTWAAGDRITDTKLNKIEDGIDGVNRKVANVNNINDTTASATTTYSSNKIENIKENLSSQIKETENLNELKYNVKNFGAVGDGVTDDTEHLQTAIDTIPEGSTLYLQNKTYIVTKTLIVKKAINIIGEGKKISFGSFSFNNGMTEIRKINGDENGDSVMFIDGSEKAITNIEISNIMFTASSSQNIDYDDAILNNNASSYNTSYGLKTSHVGESFFENIGVRQAKVAGLLASNGAVNSYKYCNACSNYVGFDISVFDSCIEHSWANHNITNGMAVKSNYFRVLNCRFEWNAKNGVYVSGGESTFVSNLFDRNGFAGLSFSNGWGHVVTGNYFSRNGCGGDGVTGRFRFSVPGHKSYIETPENECCHIRLNYMRDVTITGNRYRAGSDDAGGGVNSPCSIYCFSNAVNCKTVGNAGEYEASSGHGGFTTHNLYEAKVMKKDDSSSPIFDYVKELPSEHSFSGINLQEVSEFTVKLTSSHSEIDVWGIVFQNTLMSKIIVNVGSSANILKVIDYGGVTVNASFNDDKTELTVTLSQKCWTKYNIKSFV